jgi:hypothetical protein
MQVGVITNPNSKKNYRRPHRRRSLEQAVGRHGVVRETRSLDELPGVAAELLDAGCKYWVCDGGDGTLHWVLNSLYAAVRARTPAGQPLDIPVIVPTNGGTVDFVARKAGLKGDADSIVRRLVTRLEQGAPIATIEIDTCRVHGSSGADDRDADFDRIGLAAALGGVASAFFDRFYALPKERGALAIASVIGAAAGSALVHSLAPPLRRFLPADTSEFFRPTRARVEVDGETLPFSSFASMQIGAIDINLAGVVRCFKHAREGGVLHFQALSTTPMGVVCNLPNMVLGTRMLGSRVFDDRARRVRITAEPGEHLGPVIDGEQFADLARVELSLGPTLRIPTLLPN